MSDLEKTIREAREALPAPEPQATERARSAVLSASPARRRRKQHIAVGAVAFATALAAAFAGGLTLASGGATSEANGPGFLPAQGWDTFQTGMTEPPQAPTATAANVKLGPDALSGTFPWQTIATLRAGQTLLQASFAAAGENTGVDAQFPRRSLPLSLDDARAGSSLEGQPPNVTAYRLDARVNGWNVELFVFFGGRAMGSALAAAQDELDRLVVPEGPAGVLTKRPALRPAHGACRRAALRVRVELQGATGSLLGSIQVRNVGTTACSLRGRPTVELRDANGVLLKTREQPAPPLWKQLSGTRPSGWPTVRMPPHATAQVFVRLRNWCVTPVKPVFFRTYLPGVGEPIPAPARITLRCDVPGQPVGLEVGPVEPLR